MECEWGPPPHKKDPANIANGEQLFKAIVMPQIKISIL
jgi:hypothetical protein